MKKEEKLADEIIAEMRAAGLSYGQILKVIWLARRKFEELMKMKRDTK